MTMRSLIVAAALIAASAIAPTSIFAQEANTEPQAAQEAQPWPQFKSPERGFEITFPSTPKATSAAVAGQNPLIRYSFEAYQGDDTVYRLVVLEYPAGKAPNPPEEALYVKMVAAYAKDSESKVRKRGPATFAGRQGFEAITDDGIYMLVSAGPRGHATSDDAERFRNSLHLTDGEPQTTGSTPPTPSP